MNKIIFSFFLFSCLSTLQSKGQDVLCLYIERSPSAAGFHEFNEDVIQQVSLAEQRCPTQPIMIDFSHRLCNLFERMEKSSEEKKSWVKNLELLSERLAKKNSIRGISLLYRNYSDLEVIAEAFKSLFKNGKIKKFRLNRIYENYRD